MTLDQNNHHLHTSAEEEEQEQDLDALLSELDQEATHTQTQETTTYNSQRISQLQLHQQQHHLVPSTTAISETYTTLPHEKLLIDILSSHSSSSSSSHNNPTAIVHFHLPTFTRCKAMDEHLESLARKHAHRSGTRFFRINVEDAPFLVDRFRVRVLPCVMGFRGGKCVERIVGFEGIWENGGGDGRGEGEKVRRDLEKRFVEKGLVSELESDEEEEAEEGEGEGKDGNVRRGIRQGRRNAEEDDENSDWD